MDHALRRKVPTKFGYATVDCEELAVWARATGVRVVLLKAIEQESLSVLEDAVVQLHGSRRSIYELQKIRNLAERRLGNLMRLMEPEDPLIDLGEVADARGRFAGNLRDLSGWVTGRPKNPMPDEEDLRILMQCRRLTAGGRVFVYSRDAHFLGYADLIEKWWGIHVRNICDLSSDLESWRL